MQVTNASFFQSALRYIGYGASLGWHERNAGNISVLLTDDEVGQVSDSFNQSNFTDMSVPVPTLGGRYIFTTVSGSYFLDISFDAETKFCICEINGSGTAYRVVWGGNKPTSEFCGHLLSLSELNERGGGRAVYHCHPSNVIALTFLLPQTDADITSALWRSLTECAFVFPEGVGIVPFYVPGSLELAKATAEKVKTYNAVIWSHHGVFATGIDIESAFGLAHAIEKAAEIRCKILSCGHPDSEISDEELIRSAKHYGYILNTDLLK